MMTMRADHCAESQKWFTHFSLRSMTALYVSPMWSAQLTKKEKSVIAKSIQQFQLGEGSKGQRLLDRGKKYSQEADDPFFAAALALFIKEEQQHSRYLAAFMQSQGISRVARHWVDTVFRRLRGLARLELSLTVLVTAEIIAIPYYRALRDATGSATLKMICRRILEDEAAHLRYQSSMSRRVSSRRSPGMQRAAAKLHRQFMRGTIALVWIEHRAVFEAAGYDFRRFRGETLFEFSEWQSVRHRLALGYNTQIAIDAKPSQVWSVDRSGVR
ncbi:MAG: ferritin-like domain-containing protein [Candidatus Acidiferrales bacterium]